MPIDSEIWFVILTIFTAMANCITTVKRVNGHSEPFWMVHDSWSYNESFIKLTSTSSYAFEISSWFWNAHLRNQKKITLSIWKQYLQIKRVREQKWNEILKQKKKKKDKMNTIKWNEMP